MTCWQHRCGPIGGRGEGRKGGAPALQAKQTKRKMAWHLGCTTACETWHAAVHVEHRSPETQRSSYRTRVCRFSASQSPTTRRPISGRLLQPHQSPPPSPASPTVQMATSCFQCCCCRLIIRGVGRAVSVSAVMLIWPRGPLMLNRFNKMSMWLAEEYEKIAFFSPTVWFRGVSPPPCMLMM